MSSPSSSQGADNVSQANQDAGSKVHPSEYLEFATIGGVDPSTPINAHPKYDELKAGGNSHQTNPIANRTQSNDDLFHGLSAAIPGLRNLSVDARAATKHEHKMTFLRGCKLYPKAIGWSVLLSMTIVMEGYDLYVVV